MEIVYFLISAIEIVLTVFLTFKLICAQKKAEFMLREVEEKFNIFYPKVKEILKNGAKISCTLKKIKKAEKFYKILKAVVTILGFLYFKRA